MCGLAIFWPILRECFEDKELFLTAFKSIDKLVMAPNEIKPTVF